MNIYRNFFTINVKLDDKSLSYLYHFPKARARTQIWVLTSHETEAEDTRSAPNHREE